ncbi:MAG: hypothetical protein M1814_005804 [Vezdaea aestivalis]|nr:MAG: hypothetical protein M1814_005804 [Vezdaea aestivalis]
MNLFDNMTRADSAFQATMGEELVLEKLGYQQELKRSFGLLGMIGFSFGIVTSWSALGGVLISGVKAGGPPVMIWSWLGVCVASLAVAYSMAEICSAFPVAGGQYSWVMVLAPPKIARGMSWVTGWFLLIGLLAVGATVNFLTANLILGQANLVHPDYIIERWHTTLVAYGLLAICLLANIYLPRWFNKMSWAVLVWNVASFLAIVITLLATNKNKRSASFVFKDFNNDTGFSPAMGAVLGLLQAAFGMVCYDAPAHMTEEMKHASKEAPIAIISSVYMGAITGFIFLVSISFCIGDIDSVANTSTGQPLIQIMYDSTGSYLATCILASMICVIQQCSNIAIMAESSRTIYAFARDHGLPFSRVWAQVDRKRSIPLAALFLTAAVQMAFNAIYFGTLTGFLTIVAISTEGFYVSYAMPLLARLLGHFTGHVVPLNGPYKFRRNTSLALNAAGLFYLTLTSITFNFPTSAPVNKDTMNYNSAAVGVIMLISLITWITTGHKNFTGPRVVIHGDGNGSDSSPPDENEVFPVDQKRAD